MAISVGAFMGSSLRVVGENGRAGAGSKVQSSCTLLPILSFPTKMLNL
jgi:hypothetical protein